MALNVNQIPNFTSNMNGYANISIADMILGENVSDAASIGFDIDDNKKDLDLKLIGFNSQNLKKIQQSLGYFSLEQLNLENQKYIDSNFVDYETSDKMEDDHYQGISLKKEIKSSPKKRDNSKLPNLESCQTLYKNEI